MHPNSVLFILTEDTSDPGLEHVVSMARSLQSSHSYILSFSANVWLASNAGYPVEYFPHQSRTSGEAAAWNIWLSHRIKLLCDSHRIGWVVIAGHEVPPGILDALNGRRDVSTAWIKYDAAGNERGERREHNHIFDFVLPVNFPSPERLRGMARGRKTGHFYVPPPLFDGAELPEKEVLRQMLRLPGDAFNLLVDQSALELRRPGILLDALEAVAGGDNAPQFNFVLNARDGDLSPVPSRPAFRPLRFTPMGYYLRAFDGVIGLATSVTCGLADSLDVPYLALPNASERRGKPVVGSRVARLGQSEMTPHAISRALNKLVQGPRQKSPRHRRRSISGEARTIQLHTLLEAPGGYQ